MKNVKQPLVSIVTPSYNSGQFIERCIESVLAQDYPYVEHVVQDGGSTDGTVDVLHRYRGEIDWVSEPDEGQADGLNRALHRVRGDILLVLNADDELMPHAAAWAVLNMAKYAEVAVIYGDQHDVGPDGKVLHDTLGPDPYDFEEVLCVEQVLPAQAAFIRRSCFEAVGLYADMTLSTCPDYEMWVRLGLKYPMKHVPGFVARYRWHAGSEGWQVPVIYEMVRAKRQVMERVFNDPNTASSIQRLGRRAHSGALWWGACRLLDNGQLVRGLVELLRSYRIYPFPISRQIRRSRIFAGAMAGVRPRVVWRPIAVILWKILYGLEKLVLLKRARTERAS